jgi:hypothetical protein
MRMSHRETTILLGVTVFSSLLAAQPQQSPQRPGDSVQVGVPGGREERDAGAQGGRGRQAGPPPPAPRRADGRVLLNGGATASETGLGLPGPVVPNQLGPTDQVPFQPWAKALFDDRRTHRLEPHARCKASGAARQFLTPYGVEFVELPELQRIYIFDVGGPHSYRTVYMDGRSHPANLMPSYYGHSIGWWEADTLVIDTVGYNEGFWFDRDGLPHTEKLHTIEKLTRVDGVTMRFELTIDDPNVYTRPFTGGTMLRLERNTELFEYVCQGANYAHELMVGTMKSVDRSSLIIP